MGGVFPLLASSGVGGETKVDFSQLAVGHLHVAESAQLVVLAVGAEGDVISDNGGLVCENERIGAGERFG